MDDVILVRRRNLMFVQFALAAASVALFLHIVFD